MVMKSASEAIAPVTVQEQCRISPSSSFLPHTNTNTASITTFPLTIFGLFFFRTPPFERLFFYSLPSSSSAADVFYSDVLPTLKLSLSAALSYFTPLAASLIWPSNSPNPFLFYDSSVAAVSLTVAESAADFNRLASDRIRFSRESHPYIPVLPSSDSEATVIALQITLFPNQGFSIGLSNHRAVLDGKSATLFMKAWAHLSNSAVTSSSSSSLPEELSPFLDRSIVQVPEGVDRACLDFWTGFVHLGMGRNPDPRSLKLAASLIDGNSSESVRATFLLSQERIHTLRETVTTTNYRGNKKIRSPSFSLAFAHAIVCLVRAKRLGIGGDADRKVVHVGFAADARWRMKPPLPANYLGNCDVGCHDLIEIEHLVKEDEEEGFGGRGFGIVVERISRMIDEVEENAAAVEMADDLAKFKGNLEASKGVFIGVAGSPKSRVYGNDFGWGRPKLVEITSIDRTGEISLAECRNGSLGIEVGLALRPHEMELFRSDFQA